MPSSLLTVTSLVIRPSTLSATPITVVMGAISASNRPAAWAAAAFAGWQRRTRPGVAADVVALGHLLGRLQHAPVDLGLVLQQRRILAMCGWFLLHAGDALHAAGHQHVVLARDDALGSQRNGLQARGAEAVDGQPEW
jgi:hypothetical protein